MTPDDWKYVEGALHSPLSFVKLRCDGFVVTLMVQTVKNLRYGIYVYVDGYSKAKWMHGEYEESKRFLRRIEKSLFTPAQQKAEKKIAKILKRPSIHDKKFVYYELYWTNAKALRRHFCKYNQDIQLIKESL